MNELDLDLPGEDGLHDGYMKLVAGDKYPCGGPRTERRAPPKHIDSPTRVIRAADLDDPEVQRLLDPIIESLLNQELGS